MTVAAHHWSLDVWSFDQGGIDRRIGCTIAVGWVKNFNNIPYILDDSTSSSSSDPTPLRPTTRLRPPTHPLSIGQFRRTSPYMSSYRGCISDGCHFYSLCRLWIHYHEDDNDNEVIHPQSTRRLVKKTNLNLLANSDPLRQKKTKNSMAAYCTATWRVSSPSCHRGLHGQPR
jgi:hypothetical protein